ncbi:MAG: leucine-rich repeat domain-containing protein, partial [Ruminococcus sp.]|nr:leucine-rich repeat domain-containing protein [Ruminococcus sp.]
YDIDIREGTVCFPKRGFFGTTDYYKPVNAKANYGTITIPSTLEDIDPFELSYCECINVSENNPNYSSDDGVMFDKRKTTLLKFPMTKKCDRYTIPDSVTRIDNRAFQNCRDIFCVVIPESVKEIESSAFSYTNNLGEIWLPESIEKIGDFAFDCDLYSGHHSISRYHDHDVMIFLYKGEIAVPFALQGNWRKNKEEEILDRFICDKGEKREEYFKQLKSSAYKIPLALFMALVYPEYETFQAYAKRNIKTIISDVVEDNVKLMDQVLKLGYITKKNIDAIIEVSDSSGFSNVADILRKYKETLSTPKKTTKKKAGN